MRKKPPGKLLSKTAHQVEREYQIIHALEKTDVPVPITYGLCTDDSVVGTPFYIMQFLDGRIFEDPALPDVSAEDRTAMWRDAVSTLAKFHRVDFAKVGLGNFGRQGGFYDRQIKTLGNISMAQAVVTDVETKEPVGDIPHFAEMKTFFATQQPKDRVTLVHGDYKIDNLIFHKTEPRVIGILDWEMATIGHPLSDLCNLCAPFAFAAQILAFPAVGMMLSEGFLADTRYKGLPIRNELLKWYAETTGFDLTTETSWGDAFGMFRNSVIMQGIAARYAQRQASSARASDYAERMGPFGEFAFTLVKQAARENKAKL